MSASRIAAPRSLELRLLRCSVPSEDLSSRSPPPVSSSCSHLHSLLNDAIVLIESGHYFQTLSSPRLLQTLFSNLQFDSSESPHRFYSETLPDCISSFLGDASDVEETEYKVLLLMAVGVSSFLAFTQCNFTGPLDDLPCMPLVEICFRKDELECGDWIKWELWAHKELMSVGSELRGKYSNLQNTRSHATAILYDPNTVRPCFNYLVFAKTVMLKIKDLLVGDFSSFHGARSILWWLLRVIFLHQKLLDERSSILFEMLQVFKNEVLFYLGTLEKIKDCWGANEDSSTVLSMLHLELGIMELYYGRSDASRLHFESSADVSHYNFFVSGDLGFRTLHQVEPKAQLRLVAGNNDRDASATLSHDSGHADDSPPQQSSETFEASDVLMIPRFIADEKHSGSGQYVQSHAIAPSQLKSVHQAVILAQCLFLEKSERTDELQRWEMAPYIEAIDSQKSSPFILRCFCNILRVRWESTRSRTKQRALLIMEKLVQGIFNSSPEVPQRIHYCFGVNIPSIPALRKEYGDLLVSCGLIGEATKLYEDLELWDNLIYCYKLMDKKAAAIELIKKCLAEKPSDPRLWCSLGDITNDDGSYEKALEISGNRSARALRSLARSAYNRGDYEKSKLLWESAMGLNSMYPDGWFALGAAALKSRDVDKALDAFTRAAQLDPENGEAWNNIACLHMVKKRSKEAFIAFKEALKLKRNSWQMWENFSHVAADIGNFSQAMEAIQKVMDMSKMKRIDTELLDRIMLEIEQRASSNLSQSHLQTGDNDEMACSEVEARTRETENLIQLLGKILKQTVQSGGSAESWGLYARWNKLKGDLTICSEALLKQVRSYQGSDLWKDKDRFVKFAHASLQLCKVYQELALRGNSRKELFAAEMHLKSTIKQAVDFSETEEYRDLVECLAEVQESLKAVSLPGA